MRINTDRVLAVSAMLVGLGSLFIIVYQTILLREQQSASALPYLMLGMQTNSERTYLFARNTGVGPALIDDVVVRYQGRELRQDPYDFVLEVRPDVASAGLRLGVDKLIPGRLVPAGEWINMFGADGDTGRVMETTLLGLFDIGEVPQSWYDNTGVPKSGPDKAIIEVTYRSVYGERWRVSSDSVVPRPL
jgi:hypothetical protein